MTSEERRKVAARLRKDVGESSCIDYAVFRIAHDVMGIEHVTGAKAAHMLADLIDPTCHVDVNKHGRAYCTNCGCDDWCLADGSHFCPNCGARVVSDGE